VNNVPHNARLGVAALPRRGLAPSPRQVALRVAPEGSAVVTREEHNSVVVNARSFDRRHDLSHRPVDLLHGVTDGSTSGGVAEGRAAAVRLVDMVPRKVEEERFLGRGVCLDE
jgi:hypothetical protein